MQGITMTGEHVFLTTAGDTVHDSRRVYIMWMNPNNETFDYALLTQQRLNDDGNYETIGTMYVSKYQPVTVQKNDTDILISSHNNMLVATPIFDRD